MALSKYWDEFLLLEQSQLNSNRAEWQNGAKWISCLYRSKRFVPHTDILGQALWWMTTHGTSDSLIDYNQEELLTFAWSPETFT